jgi:hypothetical protein
MAEFDHYFHAGTVERGARFTRRDAYSRVTLLGSEQPWLTKREAQSASKRSKRKAKFHDTEIEARRAAGF